MEQPIVWLHISDIHFNPHTKWRDGHTHDSLLRHLKEIFKENDSLRPDLVFCTGDIAFGEISSSSLTNQYQQAQVFFDELLQVCRKQNQQLPTDRLFIVPGNHDVSRKKINSYAQRALIDMAKSCSKNHSRINQDFSDYSNLDISQALSRLDDYGQFVQKYLPHQNDPNGRHFYTKIININGLKLGIAGFNSAWSCGGSEDDRHLWLAAEYQFNAAQQALKEADIRIGLIHHPLDWLNQAEHSLAKQRVASDFNFWLHGHTHEAWVDPKQTHIVIGAGAIGAERTEEFGINLVRIDATQCQGLVFLHTHKAGANGWTIAPVARHAPVGEWSIDLSFLKSNDSSSSLPKNTSNHGDHKLPILDDFLQSPKTRRDSWQRFVEPVEFVGRQDKLDELLSFANAPDIFAWQVLYGGHATGKSRLALEWLKVLQMENPSWIVGYLPEDLEKLNELPLLKSDKVLTIVVDNAGGYGDFLWTYLNRVIDSWKDSKSKIRLLLINQTEMYPPAHPYDRQEIINTSRYSELIDTEEPSSKSPSGSSTRITRSPLPGISLESLSVQDQESLIKLAASNAGNEFSPIDIEQAIKETNGRPAFLLLAGLNPKSWKINIRGYAESLAEKAQREFAPTDDGLRVLLLSALAGPVPDSLRMKIAPNARPVDKLASFFPESAHSIESEVPRFEPDLLGQELVFAVMKRLSNGERIELALLIAKAMPDRFRDQVTKLWKETSDISAFTSFFTSDDSIKSEDNSRMEILEILFDAVGVTSRLGIHEPFGILSSFRASILASVLASDKDINAESCIKIVLATLRHLPEDSLGVLLREFANTLPCNPDNRIYWVALIRRSLCKVGEDPLPCLGELAIYEVDLLQTSIFNRILVALCSQIAMERVHAAFQVSEWANNRVENPRNMLPNFDRLADALNAMVKSSYLADRVAACDVFIRLVKTSDGEPGKERLRDKDIEALMDLVIHHPSDSYAFADAVTVLGLAFRSRFDLIDTLNWLPENVDTKKSDKPVVVCNSEQLINILMDRFQKCDQHSYAAQVVAFNLLRMGMWRQELNASLSCFLFAISTRSSARAEIIARLSELPSQIGDDLLTEIIQKGSTADQVRTIAAVAHFGKIDFLEQIRYMSIELPSINLSVFIDEVYSHSPGTPWDGKEAAVVRNELHNYLIRESGHLVHKLQAKDSTGRWAYYFVLVSTSTESLFLKGLKSKETIDLEDFGEVIASCYGETPNDDIKKMMKGRWGFDV